MSIKPIDMQIAIQKTDLYTKEFNPNNQVANNQQDINFETQKQVTHNQRQVVSTQSSKQNRIDRDGAKQYKSKDTYSNKRSNHKKENKDDDLMTLGEDDKGAFVDIII
ncbi:MAG: hypothetical protein GX375_06040 [Clostridiales bacterium]|nr:hypothetical protein [Clostridiales bacterium]